LESLYDLHRLYSKVGLIYKVLHNPWKAYIRDLNHLIDIGAIIATKKGDNAYDIEVNLSWATEITESKFFETIKKLPKSKTHSFL